MSFASIFILLLIFTDEAHAITCPPNYYPIALGCYSVNNGTNQTWLSAAQFCRDSVNKSGYSTIAPQPVSHLLALEHITEKNALSIWLQAYLILDEFWIDGVVSTSIWDWSNQSITWYFSVNERAIIGNGSNYKFAFNSNMTTFQIADDISAKPMRFICEFQVPCNQSNQCENNATCYSNVGKDLCLCAPGYTGSLCETEIDECLSSPCLYGGECMDKVNGYICNCTEFYTGSNCEIPLADRTMKERLTAFWSVVGTVAAVILILTFSDMPWKDIITTIKSSCNRSKLFSKKKKIQTNEQKQVPTDLSGNNDDQQTKTTSEKSETVTTNGINYPILTTVWNPDEEKTLSSHDSRDSRSLTPNSQLTPDTRLIQSFIATTVAKQKQKQLDDQRVYAVPLEDHKTSSATSKDTVDTMVTWTQQLQHELRNKRSQNKNSGSFEQSNKNSNANDC